MASGERASSRLLVGPLEPMAHDSAPAAEYQACIAGFPSGMPAEVRLHLYGYEVLERAREWWGAGGSGDFRLPFWPPSLFAALGATGAGCARELELALWRFQNWRVRPWSPEQWQRACELHLPGLRIDLGAYTEDLARRTDLTQPAAVTACGWLVREGCLLLEKRSQNARVAPGVWDTPGGHLEAGESAVNALRRELSEELGIGGLHLTRELALSEWERASGLAYRHHCFWIERWEGAVKSLEGRELRWVPLDELGALDPRQPLLDDVLAGFRMGAARPV